MKDSMADQRVSQRCVMTRRAMMASAGVAAFWSGTRAIAAERFEAGVVPALAQALAREAYRLPDETLPPFLAGLDYDGYRQIRFRQERALWRDELSPFQLQMFHRGNIFRAPVRLFEIRDGEARPIRYAPGLFRFEGAADAPLPDDLGFAGFKILSPLNKRSHFDEVASFLGSSYFRAVARGGVYGLSARGLALGSGDPGEEFPAFRQFWIEHPRPGASNIVVHGLMDSPSVAGAYQFVIAPGEPTILEVTARLYPRVRLANAGVAPLTSMYLFGPEQPRRFDDIRGEVHDSDGLLVLNGRGERLWRPLANPRQVRQSAFLDQGPRGFGLIQRQRSLDVYRDFEARYDLRPSLWVEPLDGFGAGSVRLVELPALHEGEDNIVASWRPAQPLEPGREHLFRYRLHWGAAPAPVDDKLGVDSWRNGQGDLATRRRFVIDYRLGAGAQIAGVEAEVTASAGIIHNLATTVSPLGDLFRTAFELEPNGAEAIELRASLVRAKRVISEVWTYRCPPE
jgi:periplasmic glucans biosynthesis protein